MLWFLHVIFVFCFFFFKQKTAYEMRISDWSSDVCSSDLDRRGVETIFGERIGALGRGGVMVGFEMTRHRATRLSREREAQLVIYARHRLQRVGVEIGEADVAHPRIRTLAIAPSEIGRAHVRNPVTNAQLVCRPLLKKKTYNTHIRK